MLCKFCWLCHHSFLPRSFHPKQRIFISKIFIKDLFFLLYIMKIYSLVFSFYILAHVLVWLHPFSSCLSTLTILKNLKCRPFIAVSQYFISTTQWFYSPSLPLKMVQLSFLPLLTFPTFFRFLSYLLNFFVISYAIEVR